MSRAEVSVDTRRVIGPVNPLIYGHFIEHLGRCIYGGVYEEGSDLAEQAYIKVIPTPMCSRPPPSSTRRLSATPAATSPAATTGATA